MERKNVTRLIISVRVRDDNSVEYVPQVHRINSLRRDAVVCENVTAVTTGKSNGAVSHSV